MNEIKKTGLTCPALTQMLNLDKTKQPVTVEQVKRWRYGRCQISEERKYQIEAIIDQRQKMVEWLAGEEK